MTSHCLESPFKEAATRGALSLPLFLISSPTEWIVQMRRCQWQNQDRLLFFLAQVGRRLARGRSDRPKGVRSKGWGIISEIQMLVWTGSRIKGGEMLPCTGSETTALLCHRGVSLLSLLPETSSKWGFLHNITATAFSLHLNRTEPLQSSLLTASPALGLFQPTA